MPLESTLIIPIRHCEYSDRQGSFNPCLLLFTIRNTVKDDNFYYIIDENGERATHGSWKISLRENGKTLYPKDVLKKVPPAVLMGDKDDWSLFQNRDVLNLDHRAFPISNAVKKMGIDIFCLEYANGMKLVGHGITWRLERA